VNQYRGYPRGQIEDIEQLMSDIKNQDFQPKRRPEMETDPGTKYAFVGRDPKGIKTIWATQLGESRVSRWVNGYTVVN